MQCANNLKQLGLAAQSYHDSNGHLPPGIGYYPTATNSAFGTYFFHLLPHVEQDNLYRSAWGAVPFPPPAGATAVYYPGNNGVYRQPVTVFLCPSDPSVGPGGTVLIGGETFGASSYAPNGLVSGVGPPMPAHRAGPPSPPSQTARRTRFSTPRSTPAAPIRRCHRRSRTAAPHGRTARPWPSPGSPHP